MLSVPLAFFSGIGNASKHGILLKGGRVIEALANVKAVALDKTGTITSGEFKVQNVETVGSHVSNTQIVVHGSSYRSRFLRIQSQQASCLMQKNKALL